MTIEVKTELLNAYPQINLNQLIFLSLLLDKNQKSNQNVRKIISLISGDEITDLISQELISSNIEGDSITYIATDKLKTIVEPKKDYFDLFFDTYPVYTIRPDGTKDYLRTNINKCRRLYNTYVGNSSDMAAHLLNCLVHEIDKKHRENKMSYMKTMWRWLQDHQWEAIEEEMRDQAQINRSNSYGTELI
ncbi:hypothetical protein [Sharpea azabuensis]|uniref:hypothetical protein n=1 Tax=Sharpea azabuensis TaxID=322505 RepID=UPI001569C63F|nr:hypothetical protein [Sharpea azabuensis]